jgi:hypothetical protein
MAFEQDFAAHRRLAGRELAGRNNLGGAGFARTPERVGLLCRD